MASQRALKIEKKIFIHKLNQNFINEINKGKQIYVLMCHSFVLLLNDFFKSQNYRYIYYTIFYSNCIGSIFYKLNQ